MTNEKSSLKEILEDNDQLTAVFMAQVDNFIETLKSK
jgi:nitrogen-specific signal transduction histidine kinase